MSEDNKTSRDKIEEKLKKERKKEGEQKLEKLLRELNDARAVVEAKEQKASEIIEEFDL